MSDRTSLTVASFFALALVGYAFALQFSTPHLGSIDGYFHIRYSAVLRESGWQGFPPAFPWLPLTILSADRYFDHHMLFHLWLAPFTTGDLIRGAKLAAALSAAAAFLALYLFLLRWRIARAEWWAVATLAVAPGFLYRMEMPRVQPWSLVFLLMALHLCLRRRAVWLLPLAWIYTWLYDAFPLLLAICGSAGLAQWLRQRSAPWRPALYACAGTAGGLLASPYFPNNLRFIGHHYGAKLLMHERVIAGSEWHPPALAEWLGWGGLVAILIALAIALYRHRADLDERQWTTIFVATLFFALWWRSSRFIEYFVPFAPLALAFTSHSRVHEFLRTRPHAGRRALMATLVVWLAITSALAVQQLRGRPPASRYAAAARWLATHSAPATLVFLADWDDFPLLFFHNTVNRYVIGLDPSYLAERDRDLYAAWERIVAGEDTQPGATIFTRFGAAVAFTDPLQTAFINAMDRDRQATRAYEDEECIVYRIRPPALTRRRSHS